ncbi:hypothetical protein BDR07DRAFT_1371502, partial [Suillus spraguei]
LLLTPDVQKGGETFFDDSPPQLKVVGLLLTVLIGSAGYDVNSFQTKQHGAPGHKFSRHKLFQTAHLPLLPHLSHLPPASTSCVLKPALSSSILEEVASYLEAQNAELRKQPVEEKSERLQLEGRAIRRLVCLTEYVEDLIAEFDRCMMLDTDLDDDAKLERP